ncbi:NAD(P)-dependent oxidoreductase [Corynebacterium pacaense]|uniref:NAD(P)-dependent oxidoreductase n=1 Tax=Corynebacterium pacaense TaxID=1816684 RepID=UPI0009BB4BF9|nr:NAD(P)H-binding protein [Corynebacterium pacaense]
MTQLTVLGGTGYAGANIVAAAAERGLKVVSYSRKLPDTRIEGVEYRTGEVSDDSVLRDAFKDSDVVVSALSPRGELEEPGRFRAVMRKEAEIAAAEGVRLGVIGGAGSLLVAEGGPRVYETEGFPEAIKPEATILTEVLEDLRASDEALDWFLVSPAGGFGAGNPGTATGTYRVGGDILLVDARGESNLSGADLGLAVVDEIEKPAHHRTRFTVAY